MKPDPQILLEPSPVEADGGHLIGRDPRRIAADEFDRAGIRSAPVLAVIRAKCLDCCVGQADEVALALAAIADLVQAGLTGWALTHSARSS